MYVRPYGSGGEERPAPAPTHTPIARKEGTMVLSLLTLEREKELERVKRLLDECS
jgi:hypothetical protein